MAFFLGFGHEEGPEATCKVNHTLKKFIEGVDLKSAYQLRSAYQMRSVYQLRSVYQRRLVYQPRSAYQPNSGLQARYPLHHPPFSSSFSSTFFSYSSSSILMTHAYSPEITRANLAPEKQPRLGEAGMGWNLLKQAYSHVITRANLALEKQPGVGESGMGWNPRNKELVHVG